MNQTEEKRRGPAGTRAWAGGKDGPQIVASKGKRWTDEAEARFLDQLAASCNVTLAAKAAGFSATAIYNRRRTDPGFAERWQAALDQGYVRIEMLLVRRATEVLERGPDPELPLPDMTVRDALAILNLHRGTVKGEGKYPGWRARPRSLDEMRDSILTKFEAIEAARQAQVPLLLPPLPEKEG
ncbi:MAG: hypothetical protein V4574_20670 [Pseudomonadota bacterium]